MALARCRLELTASYGGVETLVQEELRPGRMLGRMYREAMGNCLLLISTTKYFSMYNITMF